jgi:hypothetical protein
MKLLRLAGMLDFIRMLGSPNLTMLTSPVRWFLTYTANFLLRPGVLNGLLSVIFLPWY